MSNWQLKRIGDIGEVVTGRTPSTKQKNFYGGDYKLISPADLDNEKYVRTAHKRLTRLGFEQCRALPKSTVLVGCIGNVGKLGMVGDNRSATNQQINALICNSDNDPDFVYYCFHANNERLKRAAVKTTVPILNKTNFENFDINVPSLPEQKKIAHILSTVQRAIEAQERIVQTTTELKKALMHKLFTEGTRGEPQKQTEIGPIPESWEVVRLEKLFAREPQNGLYKPKKEYGTGTQILRIDDFSNDGDVVTTARNRVILSVDEIRTYGLEAGDIVVNRVNSLSHLGKTALIGSADESMVFESNMMRFSVNEAMVRKEYVFKFLNSLLAKRQIIGSAKRAVAQSSISQGDVKAMQIPKPSLVEQSEIAEALGTIELKTATAVSKKGVLQDLFRTLLHELMTAKTRIHKTTN